MTDEAAARWADLVAEQRRIIAGLAIGGIVLAATAAIAWMRK